MNKIALLSLSIFGFTIVFGQKKVSDLQLNSITTALPFLGINTDSRSGAMGDAGTALSANSNSLYWNTAMLNFAKEDFEVSISYTPWLRALANDMHLSELSLYKRIGKRHSVGGGLRYFSLGNITFTDQNGGFIREDKPNEFSIYAGYAFKLSDHFSIGINGLFAYSNLTGGYVTPGAQSKAGIAGATSISFAYSNSDITWFGKKGNVSAGITLNNIGNKVAYSDVDLSRKDFLPMNMKLGFSYTANIDQYNKITWAIDFQKMLVPTPPIRNNAGEIMAGRNNNVGVIAGLVQSFYDAPGTIEKDADGDYIKDNNGKYQVKKGSRFGEEMREINIGTGLEYWYNEMFAVRAGYFHESYTKGNRKFFTVGAGVKYKIFGLDISYLAALQKGNPLANTVRFSLRFTINNASAKKSKASTPSGEEG